MREKHLKSKSKNEEYLNKRIKALEKGKNKVDKKISYLRHKYCNDCERVYSWNRSDCTRCDEISDLVDKKEELRTIIKKEQDYIKKITEYESFLTATTSQLYSLCINAWIRHYKNKLNQVEIELKNREINFD
jgi:hypothetical protein